MGNNELLIMEKVDINIEESVVKLDKDTGVFEFCGRFLPQNPKEFFGPVLIWFHEYIKHPNDKTVVKFKMDYFNTASSKKILDVLLLLEELAEDWDVTIEWHYMENDVDLLEAGEGFSELVEGVPFEFVKY